MTVRAKLKLDSIISHAYGPTQTFVFQAVSDDGTEENKKFCKYTPNGEFRMSVNNPHVQEHFKLGNFYYVDFTDAQ